MRISLEQPQRNKYFIKENDNVIHCIIQDENESDYDFQKRAENIYLSRVSKLESDKKFQPRLVAEKYI